MKTFKVLFNVADGYQRYPYEITVKANRLTRRQAAFEIARFFYVEDHKSAKGFCQQLARDDDAYFPGDDRIIRDLFIREQPPILVEVSGGHVTKVTGIPEDITVIVRELDTKDWHGQPAEDIWERE